jgi:hypothetical protein
MANTPGILSATHHLGIKKKLPDLFSGKGWLVSGINR